MVFNKPQKLCCIGGRMIPSCTGWIRTGCGAAAVHKGGPARACREDWAILPSEVQCRRTGSNVHKLQQMKLQLDIRAKRSAEAGQALDKAFRDITASLSLEIFITQHWPLGTWSSFKVNPASSRGSGWRVPYVPSNLNFSMIFWVSNLSKFLACLSLHLLALHIIMYMALG